MRVPSLSAGVSRRVPTCMSSVDPNDLVELAFLDAFPAAFREREAQRLVAERHLSAGVDDGLDRHAAHGGIRDEQPVQQVHGNGRESAAGPLVLRAHDRDAVVAEVDVDALVRKPVDAEHAVGAAERIRNDRQPPRFHQEVADFQCLDRHHGHGHGPGRAAQHDRQSAGSAWMPSVSARCGVRAVWLAPVASTSRNGPSPLIATGAQMRPILSRRVARRSAVLPR